MSSTLVLTLLTLATSVGMGRLFDSWEFLGPFVVAALASHWLAWACRRVGMTLPTALPVSMLGLLLVSVWVLFPQTTAYGIPWTGTWQEMSTAATEAWRSFATVVAPAPPAPGFLLAGMVGIGTAALLADWAAFRVRAVFEAGIPSFTLFAFTAVLGAPQYRAWSVSAYVAALLLFVLVHQAGIVTESASWFASRSKGGIGALLQGGILLGTVAIVAAVVVGPNLPGSDAEPVIAWRDTDQGGPSKRTTVSPLVDIRGRLVEQSGIELFTVKSTSPAYWRLTSLDTFDGNIWQSDDKYKNVKADLPDGVPVQAPNESVVQEFSITALSSIWLPAAYRPERVESPGRVSFNEDSGSLITQEPTSDGSSYRVQSAIPRPTAESLQQAGPIPARRNLDRYLDLPPIPTRVARQAAELTDNVPTAYAKAKALQDWFQKNFRYDIAARQGHDGRALERFLFTNKRGYCEQFAGAFAVMARSVGLPARVAVGFTPGEMGPDGRYHVRGLNAHAWPEVYIEGFGWTYFEPTPGRGMPGAQQWTGVPAQQAPPGNPNAATTVPPTTAAPAPDDNTPTTAQHPEDEGGSVDTGAGDGKSSIWRNPLVMLGLLLLLVAVAWAVAVPAAKGMRRNRRRDAANEPAARVLVAWEEAEEALATAGVGRRRSETIDEFVSRAPGAASLGEGPATALRQLGHDATVAGYAAGAPAVEAVSRSVAAAATVEQAVHDLASTRDKVLRRLDPRPLLPEGELRDRLALLVRRRRGPRRPAEA
jgi:transglutaminase-like putative cysteine protease